MKQLVILSGKGGTGKTTVAAAFAHLASLESRIVLADADVDAANLELVLSPTKREEQDFYGGEVAVIDEQLCTACGRCAEVCRFDAPEKGDVCGRTTPYSIDPIACEGCAACVYQCPVGAIRMAERLAGKWYRSDTGFGPLFHAHLFAGQENSGKLVTQVKQQARSLALETQADYLIVDGPPGIGCPVIAAVSAADLALLVTEPTVSGAHDLERALATAAHFHVPALVCINKADINPRWATKIAATCREKGIEVVGHIPFDTIVTEAMVHGQPVTAYADHPVSHNLLRMWRRIREHMDNKLGVCQG